MSRQMTIVTSFRVPKEVVTNALRQDPRALGVLGPLLDQAMLLVYMYYHIALGGILARFDDPNDEMGLEERQAMLGYARVATVADLRLLVGRLCRDYKVGNLQELVPMALPSQAAVAEGMEVYLRGKLGPTN